MDVWVLLSLSSVGIPYTSFHVNTVSRPHLRRRYDFEALLSRSNDLEGPKRIVGGNLVKHQYSTGIAYTPHLHLSTRSAVTRGGG